MLMALKRFFKHCFDVDPQHWASFRRHQKSCVIVIRVLSLIFPELGHFSNDSRVTCAQGGKRSISLILNTLLKYEFDTYFLKC